MVYSISVSAPTVLVVRFDVKPNKRSSARALIRAETLRSADLVDSRSNAETDRGIIERPNSVSRIKPIRPRDIGRKPQYPVSLPIVPHPDEVGTGQTTGLRTTAAPHGAPVVAAKWLKSFRRDTRCTGR